ncbi:MAG: hypothetical protein ACD_48C00689G0001, partial [uncultured bacterium]
MSLFTKKHIHAFGIDISDSSVKVMLLKSDGKKIRPQSFNANIFPRGIVVKDVIENEEKLTEIIKKTLSTAKPHPITIPYVIASLPESKSFIRTVDLPPMQKPEIENAVKWEAEQHIPLSIDQVYLDWKILNGQEKQNKPSFFSKKENENEKPHKVFLTASPKVTVDPIVKVLKKCRLQPIALEVESLSTTRSVISKDLENKTVMIADLGTNKTSFILFENSILKFTSSTSTAGVDITRNIMKRTGLNFDDAEKAKIETGFSSEQKPEIFEAEIEVLKKITDEIKNTIKFYKEYDNGKKDIDRILL